MQKLITGRLKKAIYRIYKYKNKLTCHDREISQLSAVTRIRTWVLSATTRSTNHYTITAIAPAGRQRTRVSCYRWRLLVVYPVDSCKGRQLGCRGVGNATPQLHWLHLMAPGYVADSAYCINLYVCMYVCMYICM